MYLEFKPLEAGVLLDRNGVRRVPCNKSEIFSDTTLTVVEKRILMKFIEYCSKLIEDGNFEPQIKFVDVLNQKKIPENLKNILLYAVLLINNEDILLGDALACMEKYVSSLGVYKDNCALLYPMYGSSDIPQGFCRMCAVYEGTYVITEELLIEKIVSEGEGFKIFTSFGELKGKHVYLNPVYSKLDDNLVTSEESCIDRAVILCKGVLKESDGPVLLSIPPNEFGNTNVVYILQLGESSSTVPSGYSMLHLWSGSLNPDIISTIISAMPIEVIFSAQYTHFVTTCKGSFTHVFNPGGIDILSHFVTFI